jgi:transketolase
MRNAFLEHLAERVAADRSIFLVVGDLGYSVVDSFAAAHPERFLNAGVAEQNMTSVACGLAREGYKVFTYSIANFTTFRCLEQIRNDVCYHNLPVCVVSVGGGFMYGHLGPTHHATEDIAVMRALPNMRVFVPFCKASARRALDEVLDEPGPAYIRLGREGLPCETVKDNGLTLLEKGPGEKVSRAVLCVGKVCPEVQRIANESGADLFGLCRINPLPEDDLAAVLGRYEEVSVVEDHQRAGGAFSAISEFASGLRSVSIGGAFSSAVESEDGQRRQMMFISTKKTDGKP